VGDLFDEEELLRTPGINPDVQHPLRRPLINRPQASPVLDDGLRDDAPMATRPRLAVPPAELETSPATRPRTVAPQADFNPQPALGASRPRFADEYDNTRHEALLGLDEKARQPGGRRKLALQNALLGALSGIANASRNPHAGWREMLAGAAGGAGTAGIVSAARPDLGANLNWEMVGRPRYEQERERRDIESTRVLKRRKGEAELATEESQRRNYEDQMTMRGRESSRQDEELRLRQRQTEQQLKLEQARLEAVQRGTPSRVDLEEDDGTVSTYNIFPDGTQVYLGKAARDLYERRQATTSQANTQARIQAGDRRTDKQIAAGDRRAQSRATAPRASRAKPITYVPRAEVEQYAKDRGKTFEQALSDLMNLGYRLAPK